MNIRSGRSGAILLLVSVLALSLSSVGCEDDTVPVITKFDASPLCDIMQLHTEVILDAQGNVTGVDTLGTWLDVTFFGRATSGNEESDPTGGNSPLQWRWDFGDGTTASNVTNPIHRYTQAGTYTVTLTVEDTEGDQDSRSIQVLVGEAYTDLDILSLAVFPEPTLLFTDVPGSVSAALETFGGQKSFDAWAVDFRGELTSSCSVSGLFETFDWSWTLDDSSRVDDLNPIHRELGTAPGFTWARAKVTELVTGIAREDSSGTWNPVGARVAYSLRREVAPGVEDRIGVYAYFLEKVTDFEMEIEFADSALSLQSIDFMPEVSALGLTPATQELGPGRHRITLTAASPVVGAPPELHVADLVFIGQPISVPLLHPILIRNGQATRDGIENTRFVWEDGGVRLDIDCNGDLTPDTYQLEFFPNSFPDCNGNGRIDSCDIASGNSQDVDADGIPDECQ